MCDSTGMPYAGEICALSDYLEDDWYMPEILCDTVDEDGNTVTSLASGLCNAWQDVCTNSIPSPSTMCNTMMSAVPWDSLA